MLWTPLSRRPLTSSLSERSRHCSASAPTSSITGSSAITSRRDAARAGDSSSPLDPMSKPPAGNGSLCRSISRRRRIPKPHGIRETRQYEAIIATVKDRIAQQAAKLILEPIFEADFLPCSFGFRPTRSATDAMEKLRVGFTKGNVFVFEADILNFFGEIDHDKLLSLVEKRVSDRRVQKLLRGWLSAGVVVA